MKELPKGWEWKKLREVCEVKGGKRLPKGATFSESLTVRPYIRVTDMVKKSINQAELKYVSEEVFEKIRNYTISNQDVYITIAGTIGLSGIIPDNLDGASLTENAAKLVIKDKSKLNKNYLAYALDSYFVKNQIDSLIGIVGVPKLALFRIKSIEIPLPPLPIQHKIVSILEKAESLKQKRELANEEANNIIQSLFYDMFGDPIKNEKGFEKKKLSEVCDINPKKSEVKDLPDDLIASFIEMASVSNYGEILKTENKLLGELRQGFTYFKEGDVLFAKITPCMENGKGTIAEGLINKIGFGSTEFHVLRPLSKCNSKWLFILTKLSFFRKNAEKNMTGTAGQKRVPRQFLENFEISIPPISLQNQFASIVEKIESIKQNQSKATEEINILFDALMQKAFNGEIVE